mgnify:FL=1|jgi:hypothetical protein
MKDLLEKLGFKFIPQDGVEAWSKLYKGFLLFVAKVPKKHTYIACIKVLNLEIAIPGFIDNKWMYDFDKENK